MRGIRLSQFNRNARIKLWNRPFNIESENCNSVLAKGLLQFPTNKLKSIFENRQKHSAKKKIIEIVRKVQIHQVRQFIKTEKHEVESKTTSPSIQFCIKRKATNTSNPFI